jgi:hypothetical protein
LFHHELQGNRPTAFCSLDGPTAQAIFGEPSTARLERIFSELGFTPDQRAYLFLDEVQGFSRIDLYNRLSIYLWSLLILLRNVGWLFGCMLFKITGQNP